MQKLNALWRRKKLELGFGGFAVAFVVFLSVMFWGQLFNDTMSRGVEMLAHEEQAIRDAGIKLFE